MELNKINNNKDLMEEIVQIQAKEIVQTLQSQDNNKEIVQIQDKEAKDNKETQGNKVETLQDSHKVKMDLNKDLLNLIITNN